VSLSTPPLAGPVEFALLSALSGHTPRLGRCCRLLARLAGLDRERSELIAAASTMHDIGKLGVSDRISGKPGALTTHEREQMQRHAGYGHRLLAGSGDPVLELAALIAWTHHERWDGSGYPRGLCGEEIPLEGRIVSICDVFDALTSDRVYRSAMEIDDALEIMDAGRGSQFDPELLELFLGAAPWLIAEPALA
jgi:putative two-component system response regulator